MLKGYSSGGVNIAVMMRGCIGICFVELGLREQVERLGFLRKALKAGLP